MKVVIADDHPIFLAGLESILVSMPEYEIAGKATNGKQAVDLVKLHQPSLVILDIDMPVMNGIEAAEIILKETGAFVVILTMHKDRNTFLRVMDLGVQGYVLKENAIIDMEQCLLSVFGGGIFISPQVAHFLLQKTKVVEEKPQELEGLTASETRILKLVAQSKTTKTISEELFVSEKTVTNHRYNISQKLNLKGSNSLLLYALKNEDWINKL